MWPWDEGRAPRRRAFVPRFADTSHILIPIPSTGMSTETGSAGVKRRDFLKIVGATGAATAVVGCSSEKVGKLIPYVVNPDQTVPQVSNYYATTCRECAHACGVLAEVRDGRTFKLEGNPNHPHSRGALCSMGQSAVQGLYNPD